MTIYQGGLSRYFFLLNGLSVLFGLVLLGSGVLLGQSRSPSPSPDKSIQADDTDKPASQPTSKDKLKRWFEFDQLSVGSRYHFIENANHTKAANNDQYQFI